MNRFSIPKVRQPALVAVFCAVVAVWSSSNGVLADDTPAGIDELLAEGRLDAAVEVARHQIAEPLETDLTLPLARLARALQQEDDLPAAAEFYQHAVGAAEKSQAESLPAEKVVLIRLAAASVATQVKRFAATIETLRPLFDSKAGATTSQQQIAVSILLRAGADALATGHAAVAAEAYTLAMAHADDRQHPTAMLGEAWATAILQSDLEQASQKLAEFVRRYPEHDDAPRAARARAQCLKQAGESKQSQQQLETIVRSWPNSSTAMEIVRSFHRLAPDLVPSAAVEWLMQRAETNRIEDFDLPLTRLGLSVATAAKNDTAWTNLARHLAALDDSGQATSDLLSRWFNEDNKSDAERLALLLISPPKEIRVTPQAREAACRWAGRQLQWSMLALASAEENLTESNPVRTVAIERLMAEALVQTGKTSEARRWWNHLVDRRHADDFPTLLRCAEMETSAGTDASLAEQRIGKARDAAANDRFRLTLVNLLDAELAIRQSKFDQARALLESVVRESDTSANLRGRAQWLIGETWYLQQRFANSIDAYRLVEGIDPGGNWVSASLLQAGKAFEQLGRPQEASVCYGHLLRRFAESPYAATVRSRMAALSPPSSSLNR